MVLSSIDTIVEAAEQVKGFLDAEEGRRLHEVALKAAKLGPCLEIGSYCGKSALYLGAACRSQSATLYSIDHHHGSEEQQPGEAYFDPSLYNPSLASVDTFQDFRKTLRLAGLEDTVVPIVAGSEVVARHWATPLSLVFIDGGHALETVSSDYKCWSPHILPDGYLMIHDIFPNPDDGGQAPYEIYRKAVQSKQFIELPMTGTLGVLKKK